jgi:virginiamycin B lyase
MRFAILPACAVILSSAVLAAATWARLPRAAPQTDPGSAAVLAQLPDGEFKRRFVLDCTGCHQMDTRVAYPGGQPRTAEQWEEAIKRMVGFAGAGTPFPIISAERDPAETARWLAANLRTPPTAPTAAGAPEVTGTVRAYPLPEPRDLPHDVALDRNGRVLITGMMTGRMYLLDPESGAFETVPIPVERANPRALDVAPDGTWWVLLGGPQKIAQRDPRTGEWRAHDIGMYPHSVQRDARGRIWFNGHFTKDPELIGYLDEATGRVQTYPVPNTEALRAGNGPIPYDLRIATDGTVWGTELHGNRLIRFDPQAGRFQSWDLPTAHSGPRRMDVAADGGVWIAQYAAGKIAHFDPRTERFTEHALPDPNALPYVVRVDDTRGRVWVGTGAGDRIYRLDVRTGRWTAHPLPAPGALIRHMALDPRNGDLWAAYGASPGVPALIVRVWAE